MLDINTILAVTSDDKTCARCQAPVGLGYAAGCTWNKSVILHVDCAVDVNAAATANAMRDSNLQFDGRDALLALADARVKAEADANRSSKKSGESPIEPARDRQGRPRVRVLFVQSEAAEHAPTSDFFGVGHLLEHWQLRSSVREYVLIFHQYPKHTRIDPSQPFVGAMYWQRADKPVATRNGKLVEWKSLGLATPVLVVVGASAANPAVSDPVVAKLRSLLAASGFEPDDAPVVIASSADERAREALALALDEQALKVSAVTEKRKAARMLDTITELVESGREDGLAQGFIGAFKRCSRARAEERAHVFKLLAKAAERHPEETAKAITGIERYAVILEDREAVLAVIRALLAVPKKVPAQLERWAQYFIRDDESDTKPLAKEFHTAIDAADARKAKKLAELAKSLALEVPAEPTASDRSAT